MQIDNAAVNRLLVGRGGAVNRDLQRRAQNVAIAARRMAPGSMARKITSVAASENNTFEITCSHPATLYVVRGTRPHVIIAHGKALKFKGHGGRTVFRKRVNHPGNKPNNFMERAVRAAGK